MANPSPSTDDGRLQDEEERIKQLGDKSSQTLLFLSFALVVVATLKDKSSSHQFALREAMRWWSGALFPIVLGVLPLKEFNEGSPGWYRIVRWLKVALLWVAIIVILVGAAYFTQAVQEAFSA